MANKDKLISFPVEVLEALDDYRKQTGIPATDYIRLAVIRKMVSDRIIKLKQKVIEVANNNNKKYVKINAPPEAIKFCDSESCEVVHLDGKL